MSATITTAARVEMRAPRASAGGDTQRDTQG